MNWNSPRDLDAEPAVSCQVKLVQISDFKVILLFDINRVSQSPQVAEQLKAANVSMTSTAERAASESSVATHLDYANQYVSFMTDGQLLGIPVTSVQEVLNPQTITPVPLAAEEISGLLNLRGQIVTAVNLRRRLGLPELEADREAMNVVVRHQGESYSLLVDEVQDVINVAGTQLLAPPTTLDAHWKSVTTGVFRLEHSLFVILSVGALLTLKQDA